MTKQSATPFRRVKNLTTISCVPKFHIEGLRPLSCCFPRPTPHTPTRWQGSSQKAQTTFPTLAASCTLAQAKALGNSRSLRSRRLSARNEHVESSAEARCQTLPLHPPLLPRAFASPGPAPSSERPQGGRNKAQQLGREETIAEEKESNDKKLHSMPTRMVE